MKLRAQLLSVCLVTMWIGTLFSQVSPHIITFFVRPLPIAPSSGIQKAIAAQKKRMVHDKILQPVISKVLNLPFLHAGLYASYAGTITHSDKDGQILFERKSAQPKLRVLITNSIKPIPVDPFKQKTLFGFLVAPDVQAQEYLFERLQDPETEQYAWHVSPVSIDKDMRIPYDTVILYANPQHIIVPLGPTATTVSENFVLPDFYVTEGYNSALNTLRFLKIRHYFAPMTFDFTFLPSEYQKKISSK